MNTDTTTEPQPAQTNPFDLPFLSVRDSTDLLVALDLVAPRGAETENDGINMANTFREFVATRVVPSFEKIEAMETLALSIFMQGYFLRLSDSDTMLLHWQIAIAIESAANQLREFNRRVVELTNQVQQRDERLAAVAKVLLEALLDGSAPRQRWENLVDESAAAVVDLAGVVADAAQSGAWAAAAASAA